MNFMIENIAGGNYHTFRKLTSAAKYIATHGTFGGYRIVGDVVSPDSDYDDALAVVQHAEQARNHVGKNDWDAVVDLCLEWFHSEPADDKCAE